VAVTSENPGATSASATTGAAEAFIRAHVRLAPVADVEEIVLYQADEPIGLWEMTEGEYRSDQPPPFWAFAWAGGRALARYVLDHPELVAGRRVLDLAAGSGLVAIAAVKAGAADVRAVDIDPLAAAAMELNAAANGVSFTVHIEDILDSPPGTDSEPGTEEVRPDVVFAGDVFYSREMSRRMLAFLQRATRAGARVLIGDPDRAFVPREHFVALTTVDLPVPPALDGTSMKRTTVWELPARAAGVATATGHA
jgi:predicted nicotinamide N-methyase